MVGSAPGGELDGVGVQCWRLTVPICAAAVFFATYDTLKRHLPIPERLDAAKHMLAASAGEVVSRLLARTM